MRRLFNILLVSMLSLMVVYLSVGTTIMHCLRTNEVRVLMAQTSTCCEKQYDHCCKKLCHQQKTQSGKHLDNCCMDYQHLKLSPTLSVQKVDFNSTPLFAGIVPSMWTLLPYPIVSTWVKTIYNKVAAPHAPPRAYLALIRILVI